MKRVLQYTKNKAFLLFIPVVFCFFGILVLTFAQNHMKRQLDDQEMAERWSEKKDATQISAFYGENEIEDRYYFKNITVALEQALAAASLTSSSENPNARLWIDALSKKGKVTLESERGSCEMNAIGISGEFFRFHPLQLVSGAYISPDSLMQDGLLIDEETAWQLFGSSNVAGMQVILSGVPHIVLGVYEREEGRVNQAAGLKEPLCFLSLESLESYGTMQGGFFYEIVLPNPIKDFGISTMNTILEAESREIEIVENTGRYEMGSLLKVLQSFGTRSMSSKSIIYPYWENRARGYEDIFSLFLIFKILLLIYPGILFFMVSYSLLKKRTWSLSGMFCKMGEKYYEFESKRMKKKQEKENQNIVQ